MAIENQLDEVYKKFEHLDTFLSDENACAKAAEDISTTYLILGELWRAIKAARASHSSAGKDMKEYPKGECLCNYCSEGDICPRRWARPVPPVDEQIIKVYGRSKKPVDWESCKGCHFKKDCSLTYLPPCGAYHDFELSAQNEQATREKVLTTIEGWCKASIIHYTHNGLYPHGLGDYDQGHIERCEILLKRINEEIRQRKEDRP